MSANKVKYGLDMVHIALKGVSQAMEIEVTNPATTDGEVTLEITADNLLPEDSPASVVVPLATENHGSVEKVAAAAVHAINNDDVVSSVFYALRDGAKVKLITKVAQDNDATLDITFTDTGTVEVTMGTATEIAEGTTGWGTPQHVPGAVNLSTSPEGDTTEFYADNTKYYSSRTNNGYTGDLEIANLPDDIKAEMLGMTVDNNGMLVESAEDRAKEFALMFEVAGDEKNRRSVFYRCEAARPSEDNSTSEASRTPTTDTMSIEMLPTDDADKLVKSVMELSDANSAAFNNFFDAVTLPDLS